MGFDIKQLVEQIKSDSSCTVLSENGLPNLDVKYSLPRDLTEFYSLCGGMILYEEKPYSAKIVSPHEFVPANPILIDADIIEAEKAKGTYENERSIDWYIIASLGNSDYIVIDLNPERMGHCYKAFWDSYPSVGDTPVIANSFTELLEKLLEQNGDYWYFMRGDFTSMGDAYDGLE